MHPRPPAADPDGRWRIQGRQLHGEGHHLDLFHRVRRLRADPQFHRQARRRLPRRTTHGGTMIGYVTLGTDDLERARGYFDALFATLGATRLMQFPDEDGGFTMWGTAMNRPGVVITRPYDKQP